MVRNLGEKSYIDVHLSNSIEEKESLGPRIITCGRGISILGGHGTPAIRRVSGADDARLAVREHVNAGVDQIKIIASGGILTQGSPVGASQMTEKELYAISDEAKAHFKPICAHAHGNESIKNCIDIGVASIEHCSLGDEDTFEKMAEYDIYMVPTFSSGEMIIKHGKQLGIDKEIIEKTKKIEEEKYEKFRCALKKKVKVAMGTDASTPYNNHGNNAQELNLMVEAGMSPIEAIIATTYNAAKLCGMEGNTGVIEEGKYADLLITESNPLKEINSLQDKKNIFMLFKEGDCVISKE